MTDKEAIEVLNTYDMSEDNDDVEFKNAINMALAALSRQLKTANWIIQDPTGSWTHNYQCSCCGYLVLSSDKVLPRYCGHCGSRMKGAV